VKTFSKTGQNIERIKHMKTLLLMSALLASPLALANTQLVFCQGGANVAEAMNQVNKALLPAQVNFDGIIPVEQGGVVSTFPRANIQSISAVTFIENAKNKGFTSDAEACVTLSVKTRN
jgi:hypothetical protein